MSNLRQRETDDVLVRFWSLDHHRAEELLWPISPWPKLIYSLEGTLQVSTDTKLHILPSNRALLLQANEHHPSRTMGKASVRTLHFAPQVSLSVENRVLEVRPFFRELIAEACRIGPLRANAGKEAALALLHFEEVQAAPHFPTSIQMPSSEWLNRWALRFLSDPTVPLPAEFSRRTVERRILLESGLTLGQWCQQARALIGLRSLSKGMSVQEAANEAGFETSSGFIHSFRAQFGTTPGRMFSKR